MRRRLSQWMALCSGIRKGDWPAETTGLFWPGAAGIFRATRGDLRRPCVAQVTHSWHSPDVLGPLRRFCLVGDGPLFRISQLPDVRGVEWTLSCSEIFKFLSVGFWPCWSSAACEGLCRGHLTWAQRWGVHPNALSRLLRSPWRSNFAEMSACLLGFLVRSTNHSVWELHDKYGRLVLAVWKEYQTASHTFKVSTSDGKECAASVPECVGTFGISWRGRDCGCACSEHVPCMQQEEPRSGMWVCEPELSKCWMFKVSTQTCKRRGSYPTNRRKLF